MSFNIPKIVYGDAATEIAFSFPPEVDDGESLEANERVSQSISGVRQVSVDSISVVRAMKFSFLSDALKTALETFYKTHALYGKSFKFFEDKDGAAFVYYDVLDFKFIPKRSIGKVNYPWSIPLKFRRVLGLVEGDNEVLTILNNQASAVNLTGIIFDSTEYTSAVITGELRRRTDSSEVVSQMTLTAQYRTPTADWIITQGPDVSETPAGVTFSILSTGQVQYVSDNLSGTNYVGVYKVKQSKFSA